MNDRSKAMPIPLRELQHSDPKVLNFMQKSLDQIGEPAYVSWMQTATLDRNGNGDLIYRALNNWAAMHLSQSDRLGFGKLVKTSSVPAVVICKPDGSPVLRIEDH